MPPQADTTPIMSSTVRPAPIIPHISHLLQGLEAQPDQSAGTTMVRVGRNNLEWELPDLNGGVNDFDFGFLMYESQLEGTSAFQNAGPAGLAPEEPPTGQRQQEAVEQDQEAPRHLVTLIGTEAYVLVATPDTEAAAPVAISKSHGKRRAISDLCTPAKRREFGTHIPSTPVQEPEYGYLSVFDQDLYPGRAVLRQVPSVLNQSALVMKQQQDYPPDSCTPQVIAQERIPTLQRSIQGPPCGTMKSQCNWPCAQRTGQVEATGSNPGIDITQEQIAWAMAVNRSGDLLQTYPGRAMRCKAGFATPALDFDMRKSRLRQSEAVMRQQIVRSRQARISQHPVHPIAQGQSRQSDAPTQAQPGTDSWNSQSKKKTPPGVSQVVPRLSSGHSAAVSAELSHYARMVISSRPGPTSQTCHRFHRAGKLLLEWVLQQESHRPSLEPLPFIAPQARFCVRQALPILFGQDSNGNLVERHAKQRDTSLRTLARHWPSTARAEFTTTQSEVLTEAPEKSTDAGACKHYTQLDNDARQGEKLDTINPFVVQGSGQRASLLAHTQLQKSPAQSAATSSATFLDLLLPATEELSPQDFPGTLSNHSSYLQTDPLISAALDFQNQYIDPKSLTLPECMQQPAPTDMTGMLMLDQPVTNDDSQQVFADQSDNTAALFDSPTADSSISQSNFPCADALQQTDAASSMDALLEGIAHDLAAQPQSHLFDPATWVQNQDSEASVSFLAADGGFI